MLWRVHFRLGVSFGENAIGPPPTVINTIESGAKQIGMMRMKVPGAAWNENGARLVYKARAAYLSDAWLSLPLAA